MSLASLQALLALITPKITKPFIALNIKELAKTPLPKTLGHSSHQPQTVTKMVKMLWLIII